MYIKHTQYQSKANLAVWISQNDVHVHVYHKCFILVDKAINYDWSKSWMGKYTCK